MPEMKVENFQDGAAFILHTQPLLEQDEALNNMLWGLADRITRFPERFDPPPLMAAVFDGDLPMLAALMTPPRMLILASPPQVPHGALQLLARDLHSRGISVPGVYCLAELAQAFTMGWQEQTGCASTLHDRQNVYLLEAVAPYQPVPGNLRMAIRADVDTLREWAHAFWLEIFHVDERQMTADFVAERVPEGNVFIWEDGGRVCMAARTRQLPHGDSIGYVYTPPQFRGKGYAASCCAAISQLLLDRGAGYVVLFTGAENPVTNPMYRKIGYQLIGEYHELHFHPL